MANSATTAAQSKAKANKMWAEIQKAQKASIDSIINGNASKKDIDNLHKAIGSASKLAADVFERSIAMIDKTAQKIASKESQAQSDKEGNTISDERDVEIMRKAVADELKKRAGDILKAVDEIVEEDSKWPVGEHGDEKPPIGLPPAKDDRKVLHKMAGQVDELLKKIGDDAKKHGKKPIADIEEGADDEDDGDDEDADADDESGSTHAGESKLKHVERRVGKLEEHAAHGKKDGKDWPKPKGNSKHKKDRFNSGGKSHMNPLDKVRDVSKEWWRDFKQWSTGWVKPKSWLGELAKIAGLAALFAPQFREWVENEVKTIKDWMTFDHLKETLGQVWDYVSKEASELIDKLRKALGMDAGPDAAKPRKDDTGLDKTKDFLGRTDGNKSVDRMQSAQNTLDADDNNGGAWDKVKGWFGYSSTKQEKQDAAKRFLADAPNAIKELEKQAKDKDAEASSYLSGKKKPEDGISAKMAAEESTAEAALIRKRIEKIKADLPKAQALDKSATKGADKTAVMDGIGKHQGGTQSAVTPPKSVSADSAASAAPPPPPPDNAPADPSMGGPSGSSVPSAPASKIPSNDDSGAMSLQNALHGTD